MSEIHPEGKPVCRSGKKKGKEQVKAKAKAKAKPKTRKGWLGVAPPARHVSKAKGSGRPRKPSAKGCAA